MFCSNFLSIREGMGEKTALSIQYIAEGVASFTIALLASWKLTLITLAVSPLLIIASALLVKVSLLVASTRSWTQVFDFRSRCWTQLRTCSTYFIFRYSNKKLFVFILGGIHLFSKATRSLSASWRDRGGSDLKHSHSHFVCWSATVSRQVNNCSLTICDEIND